jgi:hypothetical protein
MKTLIFIFLSVFSLFSCSKNNDDSTNQQTNDLLSTWKLVKFEPGFSPTNNYTNEIQWTFTANTVNVVIQSGTNVSGSLPLNNSGTYSYSLNGNQIIIDNITYKYEILNNVLKIEDLLGQTSDGKKITFNKLQ